LSGEELLPLPADLDAQVDAEDKYLVQAQIAVSDCTIVTTDEKLLETLRNNGRACKHRNEYVTEYLSAPRGDN
jgi:hypothetical protein